MSEQDQPTPDPLIGQLLSERYKVLDRIGEGGMGSVYLGQHVTLGKRVALKVLKDELCHDRTIVERFLREAKATSAIEHENIVEIRDFGHTPQGSAYFVMELLKGAELADVMADGPIPWARARGILLQLTDGLAAAHELGIVHRDMKPGNVFLIPKGGRADFVKILDFGIAKVEDEAALTRAGHVFGTAAYMSPEQATAGAIDGRSDMYAVACLAFEMLSGRLPFTETHPVKMLNAHIREPAPSVRSVAVADAEIPAAVDEALLRAMAKLPDERFADMAAFHDALAAIPAGEMPAGEMPARAPGGVESTTHPATDPSSPRVTRATTPARGTPAATPAQGTPAVTPPSRAPAPAGGHTDKLPPERPDEQTAPRQVILPQRGGRPPSTKRPRPPRPQARAVPAEAGAKEPPAASGDTLEMTAPPPTIPTASVPLPAHMPPLAFCFIALSRSVEGFLSNQHVHAIAQRLQRWAPEVPITQLVDLVRKAIAEVETVPEGKARSQRLRERNTALRGSMPRERLAQVLADLYEIASDDGRVREAELRFIVTTTQQLGLSPDTKLLAIAYLYLTLGHADGTLDEAEKRVLRSQLRQWSPRASIAELKVVIRWAVAEFKRRGSTQERHACALEAADQLRETTRPETLHKILADLWRIAGADGHISAEEQAFIMQVVQRFGS